MCRCAGGGSGSLASIGLAACRCHPMSCSGLAWPRLLLHCSARVITDRETGRPKGFGFVNMAGGSVGRREDGRQAGAEGSTGWWVGCKCKCGLPLTFTCPEQALQLAWPPLAHALLALNPHAAVLQMEPRRVQP